MINTLTDNSVTMPLDEFLAYRDAINDRARLIHAIEDARDLTGEVKSWELCDIVLPHLGIPKKRDVIVQPLPVAAEVEDVQDVEVEDGVASIS